VAVSTTVSYKVKDTTIVETRSSKAVENSVVKDVWMSVASDVVISRLLVRDVIVTV